MTLKPTIINGEWVNLPPPRQDYAWLNRHSNPNHYTLQRGDDEHQIELSYQIGENMEPWMGYVEPDETVTLLAAWDSSGRVFALTDAEIAEAEEWIAGELAK